MSKIIVTNKQLENIKQFYFYMYLFNMYFFLFRKNNYFFFFKKFYIYKLRKNVFNNYFFFKFNLFFHSKKLKLKNFIFFKKKISLWKNKFNLKKFFLFYNWKKERYNFRKIKRKILKKVKFKFFFFFKKKKNFKKNKVKYPFNFKKFFYRTIFHNQNFLKSFFFKKKVRKKKFLNFIKLQKTKFIKNTLLRFELALYNIVARSKIFLSYRDILLVVKEGFVYVNKNKIMNPFSILKKYDLIQLVIFKNIYIYNKQIYFYLMKKLKRINFKIWKIKLNRYNFYKEKTKHMPNWIINYRFLKTKIPNYIEVDYLTLSIVILTNPKYIFEFNNYYFRYIMFFLFKVYKWKLKS